MVPTCHCCAEIKVKAITIDAVNSAIVFDCRGNLCLRPKLYGARKMLACVAFDAVNRNSLQFRNGRTLRSLIAPYFMGEPFFRAVAAALTFATVICQQ